MNCERVSSVWKLALPCLVLLVSLHGGDQPLPTEAWPAVVLEAAVRTYPGARIVRVEEAKDDGETIFEVRLKTDPSERDVILEISRGGEILEVDEEIPVEQLPNPVRHALQRAFPRHELRSADKEVDMEIVYRVNLRAGHERREVKLTRRGRILEIEKKR